MRWLELREEIKSHARSLNCPFVLGYKETITICEDICVLSANGTAARCLWYTPSGLEPSLPQDRKKIFPTPPRHIFKTTNLVPPACAMFHTPYVCKIANRFLLLLLLLLLLFYYCYYYYYYYLLLFLLLLLLILFIYLFIYLFY
jgi:hypothetical protein